MRGPHNLVTRRQWGEARSKEAKASLVLSVLPSALAKIPPRCTWDMRQMHDAMDQLMDAPRSSLSHILCDVAKTHPRAYRAPKMRSLYGKSPLYYPLIWIGVGDSDRDPRDFWIEGKPNA